MSVQQLIRFTFCRKDENGLRDKDTPCLKQITQRESQKQGGSFVKQPVVQLKGHRFKAHDSQRPPLSRCRKARTRPVPAYRFFTGVHWCHLDLQPIYFCLYMSYIPFILQACHNPLTVCNVLSRAWQTVTTCKDVPNSKGICEYDGVLRGEMFSGGYFSALEDFVSVGVGWLKQGVTYHVVCWHLTQAPLSTAT